jgi:hypothetical protein
MASSQIAPPLSLNSRHASSEIPELLVAVLSQITENQAARAPASNGARPRVAQDKAVSSRRLIVFNRSAHVAAIAEKEHEQLYPQTGWVEHNAEEIWQHLGNFGCSNGISEQRRRAAISMCVVRDMGRQTGHLGCESVSRCNC